MRTITVRTTIDHAQEKPTVSCSQTRTRWRKCSSGRSGLVNASTFRSRAVHAGCSVSRRRRPRRASSARSTPPWLQGLQRRSRQVAKIAALARGRGCGTRRSRTASRSGGTCTSQPASEGRTCGARPGRAAMPTYLMRPPFRAPRSPAPRATGGRGCRPARPRRSAPRARSPGPAGSPSASSCHVSRSWRLRRLRTTAFPTAFGTARPSRGSPSGSSVTREPVQRQVARRDRPALSVDRIEVLRP